ncbi:MAG: hypothetical protein HZA46_01715 [Planctomycetales bacterium]|nr:hypothetical protein [Planctomycetales bacterium]
MRMVRTFGNGLRAFALLGLVLTIVPVRLAITDDAVQPTADDSALQRDIQQLLRDLDADSRSKRQAAEKRLLELGPAVLTHFPPPELLPNAAVRDAVARIRTDLERRQAQTSVQPTRLTLRGTKTLRDWMVELSRQSGNTIDTSGLTVSTLDRQFEMTLDNEPFWKVVGLLAERGEIRAQADSTPRRLRLVPTTTTGSVGELALDTKGAFRVATLAVQQREIAGRTDLQLVRLRLEVTPEPRLRPLFLQFAAKDCTLRSGDRELLPHNPDASYELPLTEGAGQFPVTLDYVAPAKSPRELLQLRGRFTITTAAGSESIRFGDLDRATGNRLGVARRRGGVTVTLHKASFSRVEPRGHEARIAVSVAYDTGGPAFESHRQWMLHNEVFLETPEGKRIALNGGQETSRQGDGTIAVEYRFVDLPDPLPSYRFVYVAPTLILDVPVDFQLREIKW